MNERTSKKPIAQYLHSWTNRDNGSVIYGIRENIITKNENGEYVYTPHLKFLRDVKRPVWITKPEYRTYEYKKEFEDIDHCDKIITTDVDMIYDISVQLGVYVNKYTTVRKLCESPYVYGADISTETLIKQKYVANTANIPYNLTIGGLDIEADVDTEEINAITYIHEHHIFAAALKSHMKLYDGTTYLREATEQDIRNSIDRLIGDSISEHQFDVTLHIADTEVDLIKWIFDRIHECKTDFICVWNMDFDIPRIVKRLVLDGADPISIMCHPDVPTSHRVIMLIKDKTEVQHFTDKWPWIEIAGYSQFVDTMLLYSRLRKASGREPSYSLDAISQKELGDSKLHFGAITNHRHAQKYNFCDYIAYNIKDVILVMLLEWKNGDVSTMVGLSKGTLLRDYSRQTRLVQNYAFAQALKDGKVPASVSKDMYTDYDEEIELAGGAVLPPSLANIGIKAITNSDRVTQVATMVNDLDISSSYPSLVRSMNISKETQLAFILNINGYDTDDIEDWCTAMIQPDTHAVKALNKFYGFPQYSEMARLFNEYLESKKQ